MHSFRYVGNKLSCEGVALESLVKRFGTPLYVYSQSTLTDHFQKLDRALAPLDHLICFAMKSNSNLAVLRVLANLGGGLRHRQRRRIAPRHRRRRRSPEMHFCRRRKNRGRNRVRAETKRLLLQCRKCARTRTHRSPRPAPEENRADRRAREPERRSVHPRENHDRHLREQIRHRLRTGGSGLRPRGPFEKPAARAACRCTLARKSPQAAPFERAVRKVLPLVQRLQERHALEFFSIGGGLGIVYQPALASGPAAWWRTRAAKNILTPHTYAERLVPLLRPLGLRILIEPGRFISGNAGVLITRVEYLKRTGQKNFVIVDAAMNDLIRPAFYDAYHEIVPLVRKSGATMTADVVGGVCESGDFFAKDRRVAKVGEGDYLVLLSAGAYGFVMSSNYNTRSLPAEVLVNGRQAALVRDASRWKEFGPEKKWRRG